MQVGQGLDASLPWHKLSLLNFGFGLQLRFIERLTIAGCLSHGWRWKKEVQEAAHCGEFEDGTKDGDLNPTLAVPLTKNSSIS